MARRRRNTKIQRGLATAIALIILGIAGILGTNEEFINTVSNMGEQTNTQSEQQVEFVAQEDLLIDFMDVGQADGILIRNQDKVMLIDAGTNEAGKMVVNYLQNLGITKIDYLIGTHPHEDHIGGSLEQVQPQYAIIMAGKDNSYGLPTQETIDKLNNIGSEIYRTDEDGTV